VLIEHIAIGVYNENFTCHGIKCTCAAYLLAPVAHAFVGSAAQTKLIIVELQVNFLTSNSIDHFAIFHVALYIVMWAEGLRILCQLIPAAPGLDAPERCSLRLLVVAVANGASSSSCCVPVSRDHHVEPVKYTCAAYVFLHSHTHLRFLHRWTKLLIMELQVIFLPSDSVDSMAAVLHIALCPVIWVAPKPLAYFSNSFLLLLTFLCQVAASVYQSTSVPQQSHCDNFEAWHEGRDAWDSFKRTRH
jgi:hypothetical protein